MSTLFRLSSIAEILNLPIATDQTIECFLTDSRSLTFPERTLFFAIVTEKGDGHRYIRELYDRGVRAFVISDKDLREGEYPEATFLRVSNTVNALQKIATTHRNVLRMPVIGVTGSNGKTTLKELLYQLLQHRYDVGRSPKSYNSSIGVPLSILGIAPTCDLAIIEAGISQPHEMRVLEPIIHPTIGVLTNIGEAHSEHFRDLKEKAMEKLKLFRHAKILITSADSSIIREAIHESGLSSRIVTWSRKDRTADLYIHELVYSPTQTEVHAVIRGEEIRVTVPFLDEGSLENIFLSLLILSEVAPEVMRDEATFSSLEQISMRLEVLEGESGMLLLNDTYSADIDSLRIALDYMGRRNAEHRQTAVVISEFRDSTRDPRDLYLRVGQLLRQYAPHHIIAIGNGIAAYTELIGEEVTYFSSSDDFLRSNPREWLSDHFVLLKGARAAHFETIVNALLKRVHQTILDVNLSSMAHNLNLHRALLPKGMKIVAMIKAFGYGVGSYEIAKLLEQQGIDYIAAALTDEGKELREKGIHAPIIIMNPEPGAFGQMIEHGLEPNIFSSTILRQFISTIEGQGISGYPIHLKWDTGMHRIGFEEEDVDQVLSIIHRSSAVRVASIFTHLSVADDPREDDYTTMQLHTLDRIETRLKEELPYPFLKHALNTSGIMRFPGYHSDMARLGIGLYGLTPLGQNDLGLIPVAALRTILLQVRDLPAGATVGYGRRGQLTRPSRIGVIPIGYADGIPRMLGNGRITFRTEDGTLVPTCGNVCMDTIMLDLTDAPNAVEGSEITIFDATLPITRLSDACNTIHYEILSGLSSRIARRYFSES